MGLLAEQETRSNSVETKENHSFVQEEIIEAENTKANYIAHTKEISEVKTPASETIELEKLPFIEIQQVMIQTLTTFCGLMARPLIQKIQSIKTVQQLKACQMQWITSLQESRIPPAQLNQTLKLINYSVQHL